MRKRLKSWAWPTQGSLACFFCGVDSKPLVIFFIGFLGSLALASLFTFIGLGMRGQFHDTENLRDEVLRAEERT